LLDAELTPRLSNSLTRPSRSYINTTWNSRPRLCSSRVLVLTKVSNPAFVASTRRDSRVCDSYVFIPSPSSSFSLLHII